MKHILGELFVIVGETTSLEITLYISSSGDFYGGYDDSISKLGNNFLEALDTLINGEPEFIVIED